MNKFLLIGLGGTGCRVVSAVKKRIGSYGYHDAYIQYLGFDTDQNEMRHNDITVVDISRDAKVIDLLSHIPEWEKWFPKNPLIFQKKIRNGTGQLRILTRLAFMDFLHINNNRIIELDYAVRKLLGETGKPYDEIKIIIVSSLSGGLGSGLLVYMPLYLRQYFRRNYHDARIHIHGIFALPDIFISPFVNESARETMYANTYACLQELSAVNKVCRNDNVEMREYKPYNQVFLIDNLNSNRNKIGDSLMDFIDQMANVAFSQMCPPIVNLIESCYDGRIIPSKWSRVFGSAASTTLEYPYEDLIKYYTIKATIDYTLNRWRYIDQKYEEIKSKLKQKKETDKTVLCISRNECFLNETDQLMENSTYGFDFLKKAIQEKVKDRYTYTVRSKKFMDQLEEAIEGAIHEDDRIRSVRERCHQNQPEFHTKRATREEIIRAIWKSEKQLQDYLAEIERNVPLIVYSLVERFVPDDPNTIRDEKINFFFSALKMKNKAGEEHAVHPLAVRYLLYWLIDHLKSELADALERLSQVKFRIDQYYQDRDDMLPGIQRPEDMVPDQRGIQLLRNDARRYFDEYRNGKMGYRSQLANLDAYCKLQLKEIAYREIIRRLECISRTYEKMFVHLDDVCGAFQNVLESMKKRFEEPDASKVYLCSSEDDLEKTYMNLQIEIDEKECDDSFDRILTILYTEAMKSYRNGLEKHLPRTETECREEQLNTMIKEYIQTEFEKSFLADNTEQIRRNTSGELDITVYEALEREVLSGLMKKASAGYLPVNAFTRQQQDAERQELLMKVYRKTAPCLLCSPYLSCQEDDEQIYDQPEESYYIGINPEVSRMIGLHYGGIAEYFFLPGAIPSEICETKMCSRYEIQCYRELRNIQLTDIPKVRRSEDLELVGEYYKHYNNHIRKTGRDLHTQTEITPHIDIRWDDPRNLPLIDE